MSDTDNLNLFGKSARLPGGPNDTNPTARHEGEPVPGADPEPEKDLQVKADNSNVTDAEQPAPATEKPSKK